MLDYPSIFNTVAAHLLTQNAKAIEPGGGCRYRMPDGDTRTCAVGCLITDAEYVPAMEHNCVKSLADHDIDLLPERLRPFISFLQELQRIHDKHPVSSWPVSLRDFAHTYLLDASIIDRTLQKDPAL